MSRSRGKQKPTQQPAANREARQHLLAAYLAVQASKDLEINRLGLEIDDILRRLAAEGASPE
ncbi:MAG: hypothetical protein WD249_11315 [Gaiellaceae bacterium]